MNDSGTPRQERLAEPEAAPTGAAARPSMPLAAALAAAVLVIAAAGYAWTGSPRLIAGVPAEVARSDNADDAQQFAAAVQALARKLQEQPDNAEGWAMLARAYVRLGQLPDALPAFAKATALRTGDPQLLADHAEALFVTGNGKLEGEALKLIEQALKLDPDHPKSLVLAGTAAFNGKDFAGAVRHWEKLAKLSAPDSPVLPQLEQGIAQARRLAGLPQAQNGGTTAAPTPAASATTSAVRGTVTLSPTIAHQAAPTDTLFVYARPADGSRRPLAILRRQVKDLPLDFTLDDGLAMSPAAKLSLHPKVIVEARISKSGRAQLSDGDLTGRSAPVGNDASRVVVDISEVAGK